MEHETCTACGYDGARYDDDALVAAIRDLGSKWRALIAASAGNLRTRPAPEVWSALEYAAHSRDITALHVLGVDYALTTDDASVPAFDGEAMSDAAAAGYNAEDPTAVTDDVERETQKLAALASGRVADWERTLTVGDSTNTIRRMLEHALHDSMHHLDDVERGLAHLREGD